MPSLFVWVSFLTFFWRILKKLSFFFCFFVFLHGQRWWQSKYNRHKEKFPPLTKSELPSSGLWAHKSFCNIFFFKLNFYKQSGVAGSSSCSCLGAVQSDEPNINDTPGLLLITRNSTDATFLPPQRITPCLQVTALLNFSDWLTRLSRFLHWLIIWI